MKKRYYKYYVLENGKSIDVENIYMKEYITPFNVKWSEYYILNGKLYCEKFIKILCDNYFCAKFLYLKENKECLGKVKFFTNDKRKFKEFLENE